MTLAHSIKIDFLILIFFLILINIIKVSSSTYNPSIHRQREFFGLRVFLIVNFTIIFLDAWKARGQNRKIKNKKKSMPFI